MEREESSPSVMMSIIFKESVKGIAGYWPSSWELTQLLPYLSSMLWLKTRKSTPWRSLAITCFLISRRRAEVLPENMGPASILIGDMADENANGFDYRAGQGVTVNEEKRNKEC